MTATLFEVPLSLVFGQLLIGLINGAFYAMLSLGLAVIFGLLRIINFTHGAQYMLGAFCAWFLLQHAGIGYWAALIIAPLVVGAFGVVLERLLIRRVYRMDHKYGLLLTFGLALVIEGVFRHYFGTSGQPYSIPAELSGGINLGFMFVPWYRAWVIVLSLVVCLGTWLAIERTSLGARLRAATENPALVQTFGINVPWLITLTYGFGVALAALGGVLAAPIHQVNPLMGSHIVVVVFAVVVIGGMGSLLGAIVSGFMLGVIEGLTKAFYPEASATIIFVVMTFVLILRPAGLFGNPLSTDIGQHHEASAGAGELPWRGIALTVLVVAGLVAPFLVYPVFVMKLLCYALFACAFALLAGQAGLLSFGHAAYFGVACYTCAHAAAAWRLGPELSILAGTGSAALLGLVFGWLAIRRQGIYFAMVTLALAQMVYFAALQAPFTGGEDGIQQIPRGSLFGFINLSDAMTMYYFVLAVFLAGFLIIYRTVFSPFGQMLRAIRDNEKRAVSLGFDPDRFKLLAFVLSAALSGLAGSTKTLVIQIATLSDVHWGTSGAPLLMALVGGMGSVFGPVLGAITITAMEDYLAEIGAWVTVVQGLIFVLVVVFFRNGIAGAIKVVVQKIARLRHIRPAKAAVGLPTQRSST